MVMGLRVIGIFSLFGSKDYPIPCGLVLGTGTLVLGLTPLRTCDTSGGASPTCRIWWSRQSSGCWRAPRRKLASMCNRCPTPAMSMTCKSPVSRHLYFTGYHCPQVEHGHITHVCAHTPREETGCFDFNVYFTCMLILVKISFEILWRFQEIRCQMSVVDSLSHIREAHVHIWAARPPFIFYTLPFWLKFAQCANLKHVMTNTCRHTHIPQTQKWHSRPMNADFM